MDAVAQPWILPPEIPEHQAHLRFTIHSVVAVAGAKLALEDGDRAELFWDGVQIPAVPDGWYVDRCILTVPLPDFAAGEHTLEIALPFGRTSALEDCYLLGWFDVQLRGTEILLTPPARKLGFGSIAQQGLPFYGGNLRYKLEFDCPGGNMKLHVPQYRGALLETFLDGKAAGEIVFAPYDLVIPQVSPGRHCLELKLYGTRYNTFGQLHCADPLLTWGGPNSYRTEGDAWCEEYRLRPQGILSTPKLYVES